MQVVDPTTVNARVLFDEIVKDYWYMNLNTTHTTF